MKTYVALSVVLLMMALPASADLYTWTDADGVKHYTNEPPPTRQGVEQRSEIKHSADQYDRWEQQRQADQDKMRDDNGLGEGAGRKSASTGVKATGRPGSVVMYATKRCGYCAKARAFFKRYAVSYTEYDITSDMQAYARFKKLNGRGVPLILVGNSRVSGFNEEVLRRLLGIEFKQEP